MIRLARIPGAATERASVVSASDLSSSCDMTSRNAYTTCGSNWRPEFVRDEIDRFLAGYTRPVGPGRRDGVEHIGHTEDPTAQADLLAGETRRVPLSVPLYHS